MRIIVTDDDKLVALSLKTILESTGRITVEAMASCGEEAVRLYDELSPDVMLMDIRMEDVNGLDASEQIICSDPSARILLLTTFLDDEYINRALKVGVKGYVLKQDCKGLPSAVRAISDGQTVFGGKIVEKLPDIMNRKEKFDYAAHGLSDKERQLIELVADGLSNKEIAEKMFLGEGTVRNMMSTVLDKLDLRDRTQLACFYYQEIKP